MAGTTNMVRIVVILPAKKRKKQFFGNRGRN
jgi:hypothetical protein